MTDQRWLIDKSALVRLTDSPDMEIWSNRIERGLVHITGVTRLEVGFSAECGEIARREFREPPLSAMPVEYLTPRIEDRALEVQTLLADRTPPWPVDPGSAHRRDSRTVGLDGTARRQGL